MDIISSFLCYNYGKVTTTALVCILIYKNLRLQQSLSKITKKNNVALRELIASREALKKSESQKEEEYLSEVIFFQGRAEGCADHVIDNFECPLSSCPAYKVRKIVSYIDTAKTSLDLCLCLITNKTLGAAFLRAWKRGVNIRVITDEDFAFASGSQIVQFIEKNIPVQVTGPPHIMHHKFLIVDSTLVLNGSMNWTTQAVSGNYEHVEVAGNPVLARKFQNLFDTLYETLRAENSEDWWRRGKEKKGLRDQERENERVLSEKEKEE